MRTLTCLALAICFVVAPSRILAQETAGIGALLGTEGADLVVKEILPDSVAALNKAIHVGDRIIAVAQDNEPPVQVRGKGVVETVPLIRGAKGTTVRLTIIPAGKDESQAHVVSLVRGELKELSRPGVPFTALPAWGNGVLLASGSKAPNIALFPLSAGKPEHLTDFAGKVVVLEFWATWCGPCQKVMADLQSYPAQHPDWKDKVVLLAASVDEDENRVLKHLQAKGWDKTRNVRVGPDAKKAFHVGGLPTVYVIDQQGKVVVANYRLDIPNLVNSALRRAKDEAKAARPALRVGQSAPPLHLLNELLQAPADTPTTLDRLKGKAVVLEFWGTWCAPCIAAFPHLNELVKDTRGEPVAFIAITDEPANQVAAFLKRKTLATWVGIDDKGFTTMGYGIRSWPTTVLIDPDGVVRGVTTPDVVTAAMIKDLANRRPLKLPDEDLPQLRTDKEGGIDLGRADFLVYFGPPNDLLGNPMIGPNEVRSPRCSARLLLEGCYQGEAGGFMKSPRVAFDCAIPEKDFGYAVRVPKRSGLSQFVLLRQAAEGVLGFHTRGDRERRDQDVLVLKHVGPAAPPKAGGNAALGPRITYPPNGIISEGAPLWYLSYWIERQTKKLVLDETSLLGNYDWRIKVKSFELDGLNAALKEIGLALTPERRKVEYIVVRRIDDPDGK